MAAEASASINAEAGQVGSYLSDRALQILHDHLTLSFSISDISLLLGLDGSGPIGVETEGHEVPQPTKIKLVGRKAEEAGCAIREYWH